MKAGEVSEPIRTPSGFHLFRLNELRGGAQQSVVSQVHARHILLRTSELEDDQTVEQKLADIRERIAERRRGLRRDRRGDFAGSGLRRRRRRSGLGRPGHVRAGVRKAARRPEGKRDQPSRSRRSTAGTSCSCSAAASTTPPRT